MPGRVAIVRARTADRADAFAIFHEYFEDIDVEFRDDDAAVASYLVAPSGLWLARDGSQTVGCIAIHPLAQIEGAWELKRMYVRASYRRRGVAKALLDAAEAHAAAHGADWIYLDTKAHLLPAIRFYRSSGYEPIERYNNNSEASFFMRRRLAQPGA